MGAEKGRFKCDRFETDEELCRALERGEREMTSVQEAISNGTLRSGFYWDVFRAVPAGLGWRVIWHRVDVAAVNDQRRPSILMPEG